MIRCANDLAELRDLATAIAPELRQQPLYVVDAKELVGLPCGENCLGWAAADMFFDRAIADRLGDRYRGPGNLFALDFAAIKAEAAPGNFHRCVLNIAIHETGHLVPFREVLEPPDTPRVRELQAARMERIWSAPTAQPGERYDVHGQNFIRSTIHLAYRAALHGADFCWDRLLGNFSWMSHPADYLTTLLRECAELASASFAEIEAIEPPRDFLATWNADLVKYNKAFQSTSEN